MTSRTTSPVAAPVPPAGQWLSARPLLQLVVTATALQARPLLVRGSGARRVVRSMSRLTPAVRDIQPEASVARSMGLTNAQLVNRSHWVAPITLHPSQLR
jgi:hypothetical protein